MSLEDNDDVSDLFFPDTLPELDFDIKSEDSSSDSAVLIKPLSDAESVLYDGDIPGQAESVIEIEETVSLINDNNLKEELEIYRDTLEKLIDLYKSIFPARFGRTCMVFSEYIDNPDLEEEIGIEKKIELLKDFIRHYRLEAMKYLDDITIEAINDNKKKIRQTVECDVKEYLPPDDFVDL